MFIVRPPYGKAPEAFSKSIFLAGPSPRNSFVSDWREPALTFLTRVGYDGVVFVPVPEIITGLSQDDYDNQIEWERQAMEMSDVILFWVPRSKTLPGFTTNVEFGEWMKSGKCVLAFPEGAPKMRYLVVKAKWNGIPVAHTLEEGLDMALGLLDKGATK